MRSYMHVNATKFERNSSLEYYHITCNGKTKHTSYRCLLLKCITIITIGIHLILVKGM